MTMVIYKVGSKLHDDADIQEKRKEEQTMHYEWRFLLNEKGKNNSMKGTSLCCQFFSLSSE